MQPDEKLPIKLNSWEAKEIFIALDFERDRVLQFAEDEADVECKASLESHAFDIKLLMDRIQKFINEIEKEQRQ